MKNILVIIGVVVLLFLVIFYYVAEMRFNIVVSEIETIINTYKGRARIEGGWSAETVNTMFDVIHTRFPFINRNQMRMGDNTSSTNHIRGSMLEYSFEFPLDDLMIVNKAFNLGLENKKYVISGFLVSEYLDNNMTNINYSPFVTDVYKMSGKPADKNGIRWIWNTEKRVWYPEFD